MIQKKQHEDGFWLYWDDEANPPKGKLECDEQVDAMAIVKEHYPDAWPLTFHVVNESNVPVGFRVKLKMRGLKSGVSDTITMYGVGAGFELKRQRKSPRPSDVKPEQYTFAREMVKAGKMAYICWGAEAFKAAWRDYYEPIHPSRYSD